MYIYMCIYIYTYFTYMNIYSHVYVHIYKNICCFYSKRGRYAVPYMYLQTPEGLGRSPTPERCFNTCCFEHLRDLEVVPHLDFPTLSNLD